MNKRNVAVTTAGLLLASTMILTPLTRSEDHIHSEVNGQSDIQTQLNNKKEEAKAKTSPQTENKQSTLASLQRPQEKDEETIQQLETEQVVSTEAVESPAEYTYIAPNVAVADASLMEEVEFIEPSPAESFALQEIEYEDQIEFVQEDEAARVEDEAVLAEETVNTEETDTKLEEELDLADFIDFDKMAQLEEELAQAENNETTTEADAQIQTEINDAQAEADQLAVEAAQAESQAQLAQVNAKEAQSQADLIEVEEEEVVVEEGQEAQYEEQTIIDEETGEEKLEWVEVTPAQEAVVEKVNVNQEEKQAAQERADEQAELAAQAQAEAEAKAQAQAEAEAKAQALKAQAEAEQQAAEEEANRQAEQERAQAEAAKAQALAEAQAEKEAAEEAARLEKQAEAERQAQEAARIAKEKEEAAARQAEKERKLREEEAQKRQAAQNQSSKSQSIMANANQHLGTPYVWAGTTPAGFDCSGFTQYVYRQSGININRTAEQQRQQATPVSNPKVGDLVFFSHDGGRTAGHVGIYAGGGKFIGAQSTPGVSYAPVHSGYWANRFMNYGSIG